MMARKARDGTEVVLVGLLRRSGAGACPDLLQRRSAAGSVAIRSAEYQRFSSRTPTESGPLQQIWTTCAATVLREGRPRAGRRPWRAHQRSCGPRRRSIGRRSHGPAGPSTPRTPQELPPHQETHPGGPRGSSGAGRARADSQGGPGPGPGRPEPARAGEPSPACVMRAQRNAVHTTSRRTSPARRNPPALDSREPASHNAT